MQCRRWAGPPKQVVEMAGPATRHHTLAEPAMDHVVEEAVATVEPLLGRFSPAAARRPP